MSDRADQQEIAAALKVSRRAIGKRAAREKWPTETIPHPGGRKHLYPLGRLPEPVRHAVANHRLAPALPATTASNDEAAPPIEFKPQDLTNAQRRIRDARSGVLSAIERLQQEADCTQTAAIHTLLTGARLGSLPEHLIYMLRMARAPRGRATRDGLPSVQSLKRWLGQPDTTPRQRRAVPRVPDWAPAFLHHYQQPTKPTVATAYDLAFGQLPPDARPNIHAVYRWLKTLSAEAREQGRMGPLELKSVQAFVRRDYSDLEPNDVWSGDGHTFDAEVQHPFHGRPFRPEITTIIDIATRRVVGWSVALSESAHAVADALRGGVERCGIPAILYADNGGGWKNTHLHGTLRAGVRDESVLGLKGRLGFQIEHSLPYSSQARGVIERFHRTVWVEGAKLLPGFVGAAMDREARLEQFKLTRRTLKNGGTMPLMPWDLFMEWVRQRVELYNARAHRSLKGTSPDLAWRAFEARNWQPTTLADGEIDTLFRPRVLRDVRRCEVQLFNNVYFSPDLDAVHGEKQLPVAFDIHDPSRIWVYWHDGRLICTAKWHGNSRSYFPVAVVEQARQNRAKARLERVEVKKEEILAELHGAEALEIKPAGAPLMVGGRLITPEDYVTAPRERPAPPPSRADRSAAENHAEWCEIDARLARDEPVSDDEQRYHRSWPRSAQAKSYLKKSGNG